MSAEHPNAGSISVRRAGRPLGEYSGDAFDKLAAKGFFHPTDLCQAAEDPGWVAFETFQKRRGSRVAQHRPDRPIRPGQTPRTAPAEFVAASPASPAPEETRGRPATFLIWAIFIALGLAVAGVCWGLYQRMELAETESRLNRVLAELDALREKVRASSGVEGIAPPGVITGRVILRSPSGKRSVVPGMKIGLHKRAEIEAHLERVLPGIRENAANDPLAAILASLPAPLATTASDSAGAFSIKVPEPGQYVLQAATFDRGTRDLRIWMLGFDSRDPLNTPILITDWNNCRVLEPSLLINESR